MVAVARLATGSRKPAAKGWLRHPGSMRIKLVLVLLSFCGLLALLSVCMAVPVAAAEPGAGPATVAPAPAPPSAPAAVIDPAKDPGGFVEQLAAAARRGDYRMLVAGVLIGVAWLLRRYGAGLAPWLATDRGGAALALVLGVLGALGTALAAGAPVGLGLVVNGVSLGLTAAGGWVVVRRLLWPKDAAGTAPPEVLGATAHLPLKPRG